MLIRINGGGGWRMDIIAARRITTAGALQFRRVPMSVDLRPDPTNLEADSRCRYLDYAIAKAPHFFTR